MASARPATPKSILVVDDDQDIVDIIEAVLKEAGYQVDVAFNGIEALTQIRSHTYDVILCDFIMPGLSGDALYYEVERSAPWLARRFLFVTGTSRVKDYTGFFGKTGVRSVEKPFHADEVLQIVSEIIAETKD